MKFTFNPKKTAQAAAIQLQRSGGDMDNFLFIKMLYLADRKAIEKWEEPITGDAAASMEYGPVLSNVYDLTKGDCPGGRTHWEPFIGDADEQSNRVVLRSNPGVDELSKAEIAILETVHDHFRDYTWKQMCDYCHTLPEYENVGRGSQPIRTETILKAVGRTDAEVADAARRHWEISVADALLRSR